MYLSGDATDIKLPNAFTGEYKTEVYEIDQVKIPIVGQSKSLRCYNSEENKGNPEAEQNAVQWIHDGDIVQNDDRHEGASTRVRYRPSTILCVLIKTHS